jgi:hypothetical protein
VSTLATLAMGRTPYVSAVPVTERAQYEQLFNRLPFPHLTQAWGYGEGKRAQGWSVERLVFESDGSPAALCQVLVKRVAGIPVAARINRGPLFLERAPATELQLGVLRAVRNRWRYARRGLLVIAPALPLDPASDALLRTSGFIQRRAGGWGSSLIDLEPSPDAIRASFSSKWRNRLNGAIKAGVAVRIRRDAEAFEWMLERHIQNMAEKNFVGPDPRFVHAMIAASPDKFCVVQGLLADELVSGVIWTTHGMHAETFLSWTCDAGRRAGAHNLLIWHAILEMKAAGCRALDLGGYTTREKYGAYKREMKGREYRLCGEWLAF